MIKAILFAGTAALALAACSGSAPEPSATQQAGPEQTVPAPSAGEAAPTANTSEAGVPTNPAPRPVSPPPPPPPPLPDNPPPPPAPVLSKDEKGDKGARAVLQTWARALETHQFGLAWEQFGSPPASRAAYAKWWERYRTIRVSLGRGEGDAAMGSLYYTVPATLTGTTIAGKPFRLAGDVVVRRVNDVDGATPAQLRWHIGTADLKEVTAP